MITRKILKNNDFKNNNFFSAEESNNTNYNYMFLF